MNLNFFTSKFPFVGGEYIIENEIPVLKDYFTEIKIFPHFFGKSDKEQRNIPDNAVVVQLLNFQDVKLSFKLYYLISIFFLTEFYFSKSKWYYIKKSTTWLSYLKIAAKKAVYIEDNELLLPNSINYSYWMNDWALVLTFLKRRKVITGFVFRCGGFDIWNERHEGNYLPFRGLIYKYTDKVFPNTKIGENYIKNLGFYKSKIKYEYLGTTDNGVGRFVKTEPFTIVSISNVIPLKRIELIIDILKQINIKVNWVHFGSGSEMELIQLKSKSISSKHSIVFKGRVDNKEILNYYKNNTVNLFITTSESEGLPVTIQEALSFGVPVIGTNVGGISEVVNSETGFLIEKDFDIKAVAQIINEFKDTEFNTIEKRLEIRRFWQENFESKQVYKEFAKVLNSTYFK
jgi:glycosyltransferase involved in cell wall biosynthesis